MSKRRALVVTADAMLKWRLRSKPAARPDIFLQPDLVIAAWIDSRLPEGGNNRTPAPVLKLWSGPPLRPR